MPQQPIQNLRCQVEQLHDRLDSKEMQLIHVRGRFRHAIGLANEPSHEPVDVQVSPDRACQSPAWAACYEQPNASLISGELLDERLQGSLESLEGVLAMAHEELHREAVKGKGEIILFQNDLEAEEVRKAVWKNCFKEKEMNKGLRLGLCRTTR